MSTGTRLHTVDNVNWDVLPHDRARVALALYLTGDPKEKVAADAGVSCAAVSSWLAKSRIDPVRSDSHDLPVDELRARILAGHPVEDMAVHFNCSIAHLRNQIKRLDLSPLMACRQQEWYRRTPRTVDYQAVATTYTAALEAGEPPADAVAHKHRFSRTSAAKAIAEARRQGFLPPSKPAVDWSHQTHVAVSADIHRGAPWGRRVQLCDACLTPWPCPQADPPATP